MLPRILAVFSGLLATAGCTSSDVGSSPPNRPGSFALTEVDSQLSADGTLKTWRAMSRCADGQPFTFHLKMLLTAPKDDSPFTFARGVIIREPGADGTRFLEEVATAIEAEGDVPSKSDHLDQLEFSTAILGTSLSREAGDDVIGGSFTSTKRGDWIAFKLFLADGAGEVYLNVNPILGFGEFAVKDPEYGGIVLQELAKVFLP